MSEFSDHYTVFIPELSDPYAVFVLVLYLRLCLHQSFLITIPEFSVSYTVFVLVLYLGLCLHQSFMITILCSCQSFLSLTPYVFMQEFSVPYTPYVFMLALHPSPCMYLQV